MKPAMRALAFGTAILHVLLCGLAGFAMFFLATFPYENPSPETEAADDWLIGGAAAIVIIALTFAGGVIARRVAVAEVAAVAQFIAGAVILSNALAETEKSDAIIVVCALAVALPAVAAIATSRAEQR